MDKRKKNRWRVKLGCSWRQLKIYFGCRRRLQHDKKYPCICSNSPFFKYQQHREPVPSHIQKHQIAVRNNHDRKKFLQLLVNNELNQILTEITKIFKKIRIWVNDKKTEKFVSKHLLGFIDLCVKSYKLHFIFLSVKFFHKMYICLNHILLFFSKCFGLGLITLN